MRPGNLAPVVLTAGVLAAATPAKAYDMDCAIMLCMAGGFPPSAVCSAAYAEMIRRITPWPSLPPFGVCTYAAVPVALGGPGGTQALDISAPDYAWLHRTRVIWWRGWSYLTRDDQRRWGWAIRSCDHENRTCRTIEHVTGSETPWPGSFMTENGQRAPTPGTPGHGRTARRAVMMEYGDYDGALDNTDWVAY